MKNPFKKATGKAGFQPKWKLQTEPSYVWLFLPKTPWVTIITTFIFLCLIVMLRNENKKRVEKGGYPSIMAFFAYGCYFFFNGIFIQLIVVKILLLVILMVLAHAFTGKSSRRIVIFSLAYSLILGFTIHSLREASLNASGRKVSRSIEASFREKLKTPESETVTDVPKRKAFTDE